MPHGMFVSIVRYPKYNEQQSYNGTVKHKYYFDKYQGQNLFEILLNLNMCCMMLWRNPFVGVFIT